MGLINKKTIAFLLSFYFILPVFSQNPVTLASEISRLEKLSQNSPGASSYLSLARLHQLSGNTEAALKAIDRALAVSPGDGKTLAEQARLFVSIGEYEKALASINALNRNSSDAELLRQGTYLKALAEAFGSGNTRILVSLINDPAFSAERSGIYYTLWKLTGLAEYRTRLSAEFPQSPEAKIASGNDKGGVSSAPTPLWLLFPGRGAVTAVPAAASPAPAAAAPSTSAVSPSASSLLQTGLFGREDNAAAMAEQLRKAGFETRIQPRQLNGSTFWAVCVPYTENMNAMILKLKNAGFESFPVK